MPVALTIAGSDPSGGAGLQADLKTFHQHGVYGASVVTLLTVQNTQSVSRVEVLDAELVKAQLLAVVTDIAPQAAKTGALGDAALVKMVAAQMQSMRCPLVVDPVMVSKHGHALLSLDAQRAVREALLPVCTLVTPNTPEAEALTGLSVRTLAEAEAAGRSILAMGPQAVLVKGGHLDGAQAIDVLVTAAGCAHFESPRLETRQTHGTGCTLSAAITARLALGYLLPDAVRLAKQWLTEALRTAPHLGHGIGPVNHLAPLP
jgi:hydroxymethylpyrimidine/phosphomethylpyrimidine kinase